MADINKMNLNGTEYTLGGEQGGGLTADVKQALMQFAGTVLQLANHVAFDDNDPTGQTYITAISNASDALENTLYPPANLTSISAVYAQSGTVYSNDSLDSLKSTLVVTAHYSDSTTGTVASTDYALSGTLAEGISTVTVTYGGKTATFTVTVSGARPLYQWDFSNSNFDIWNNVEFPIASNASLTENGIYYSAKTKGGSGSYDLRIPVGGYAVLEFGEMNMTATGNGIIFEMPTQFGYRSASNKFSTYYSGGWHDSEVTSITDKNFFSNKNIEIYIDSTKKVTYVCNGQIIFESSSVSVSDTGLPVILGSEWSATTFFPMYIKALTIYSEGSVPVTNE